MDDFEAALAAKFAEADAPQATNEEPESEVVAEVEAAEAPDLVEQPEETEEAEAESEVEEPLRDEKGRFVAKERPDWLPPQFKSVEDFAKSYGELQSLLGRQGQELGELRKIAEQLAEQPAPVGHVDLENDPRSAAFAAARAGDEELLDRAVGAWLQSAYDEGDMVSFREAQKFEREIEAAKLRFEFAQQVTPTIENVRQESGKRALAIARRELAQQYPDFDDVMESVTEAEVVGLDPNLLGELQKTDPKRALETVYRWVAVGRIASSQTQDAASKEAKRQESLAEKRQATVATSTLAPAAREKTNVERFKDMLLEPDAHSVHHGLSRD